MRRGVLLLGALTACPAPRPPAPAPPPVSRPSPPPASLLQRRDTPPRGISATREGRLYGLFAWRGCPAALHSCINARCTTKPALEILTPLRTVTVLEPIKICVVGLGPPVEIEIRPPAGRTRDAAVTKGEGSVEATLVLPPGPPGAYAVTVTKGETRLTKEVQVSAPSRPRVRLHPRQAAPGSPVHLALVGFEPDRRVAVHIYGPLPPGSEDKDPLPSARYISALELRTTANGQAERIIQTDPSDPRGYYFFAAGPVEGQLELGADE